MPESEVVRTMRHFKRDIAAGEQRQMDEMTRRWLAVERRLAGDMEALAYRMSAVAGEGGTVSQAMLMNDVRYQQLMIQLRHELDTYTDYADRTITSGQRTLGQAGIDHAAEAITTQGVTASFNRLPVSAVQHMVGLAGNGSPLHTLLQASWPLSAQGITQELINGVALGYNPRKTARNMAEGATGSLNRMMVIARTEQLRVYRAASYEQYRQSGIVVGYQRLATHDRRVCPACLMDEGHFYHAEEEMPEHPQGRCVALPVVRGAAPPQWTKGEDWFMSQESEIQESILGKGAYEGWRLGQFALQDLVTVRPNAVWGDSLAVTPLRELTGI